MGRPPRQAQESRVALACGPNEDDAPPPEDLSTLDVDGAREFLVRAMLPDPAAGTLHMFDARYVLLRSEILVNIQKQLEQTLGASAKGILYLAGERSAEMRLHIIRALVKDIDLGRNFEWTARRMADLVALIGWGRYNVVVNEFRNGRGSVTLENSPIADAYGPSPKPVCHLHAGWLAGICRRLWGREFLCEETSCKAQGRNQCTFEFQPMRERSR